MESVVSDFDVIFFELVRDVLWVWVFGFCWDRRGVSMCRGVDVGCYCERIRGVLL